MRSDDVSYSFVSYYYTVSFRYSGGPLAAELHILIKLWYEAIIIVQMIALL